MSLKDASGDLMRKEHPQLEPAYQHMLANWKAIKGEEEN
jgi:hypothetical protein